MRITENYRLLKPESTDNGSPDPFNDNSDIIDAELHRLAVGQGKALTSTLTAGQTTLTFTDSSITANSTVDVYTSVYGVSPTEITSGTGSLTLTFDSQDSDLSVKVVIK
jgi:hypothetical protein